MRCPENERICGRVNSLCQGSFVGCSLPEECICNQVEGIEVCRIDKNGVNGKCVSNHHEE